MDSYFPLFISGKNPYNIYYRSHPNKSKTAIFVCCLDKTLKKPKLKKWFSICGKIKSIELGEMEKDSKHISYAVIDFTRQQFFRRCLDNVWLQEKIDLNTDQKAMKLTNPDVEQHITKMEEDGFTLVLPKKSKVNKFDYVPPPLEYDQEKSVDPTKNFYNFQIDGNASLKKMKSDEPN